MNDRDREHDSLLQKNLLSCPRTYENTWGVYIPTTSTSFFYQIKANVSSVQSDLGGGIHGHLGLVFSPEDYEEVSQGRPYKRPLIPAPLRITTNTAIHETQRLQANFKEAPTKQIVATLEKIYTKAI